jgi:tetratricopeptide (TPR) repeat protein
MSRTLNLVDILLTTGRHLFLMGRFTEALAPLTRLSGFRQLPDEVTEEIQSLLGEIYLQQEKYKEARRHLTAAIAVRPLKAEYFYLMATAIEEDEWADRKRAEMYYARATELEPNEPTYWADYGSYLFTIDKAKHALKAIRKAFTLGITDEEVVGQVADVLRREEYYEEAATKLRAALFHNHGAQPFELLWRRHQFQMIHADQRRGSEGPVEAVLLPFVPAKTQGKFMELGERTIRIDQAESLKGPTEQKPVPYRRPPKG